MRSARSFDARTLLAAYACDLIAGDPPSAPHPVRLIGAVSEQLERILRSAGPRNPRGELVAGALLWLTVTGATWTATWAVLRIAQRCERPVEFLVQLWLAQTTLATRNLLDEVQAVESALVQDDLPLARARLSRIVGRDTAELDESDVARAAIETLAESLCDGVVAPLCALALAGIPGAMAFKAISTLDSTIGHPESPYTFFGRVAARADDVANYLPARLTALLLILVAMSPRTSRQALRICMRDGGLHASPNAGQCEAAMAGALGVRLGGANRYDGISYDLPFIGAEFPKPKTSDIGRARQLVFTASVIGALSAVAIRAVLA